jgi:hypothetical protein
MFKKKTKDTKKVYSVKYLVHYGLCQDDPHNVPYALRSVQNRVYDSYEEAVKYAKEYSAYRPTYVAEIKSLFKFSHEPKTEVITQGGTDFV